MRALCRLARWAGRARHTRWVWQTFSVLLAVLAVGVSVALSENRAQPSTQKSTAKAGSQSTFAAASTQNLSVAPQFFGQHLMWFSSVTPQVPVPANRLWDSNTQWCQMDSGTAQNQYNFGQVDALVGQAQRLGADVEFTFGDTPAWAVTGSYPQPSAANQCANGGSAATWNPPKNETYWKNFVTALVTHEKGRIHAYELWNEANYQYYWSGSVSRMVQMSKDAAAIIHSIDPTALVLSPSITADSSGYSWLHNYLSALPPGTINAIAVHSYTNGAWPESPVSNEMQSVRQALPPAYAGLPIWSTEGGWGQNSQFSSDPSDQRGYVARYDLMMLTHGFARTYWYAYPNSQWGTLALSDSNGNWSVTPAGTATNTVNNWLSGATVAGCSSSDSYQNLWTCNITLANGQQAQVVWATRWSVWYQSPYSTQHDLSGGSSPTNQGWILPTREPVLLTN